MQVLEAGRIQFKLVDEMWCVFYDPVIDGVEPMWMGSVAAFLMDSETKRQLWAKQMEKIINTKVHALFRQLKPDTKSTILTEEEIHAKSRK